MLELFAALQRLETSTATVLIEGESGTGKGLVAREIHRHSTLADAAFSCVGCASLRRRSSFKWPTAGTLLLDDVCDSTPEMQAALVRAIDANGTIGSVVRLLATTTRDLAREVERGRFREDLLHRLSVIRLTIPPLRDQPEDIECLVERFAEELGLGAVPIHVLETLRQERWPGNARELRNALVAYGTFGEPQKRSEPALTLQQVLRNGIDLSRPYSAQKDELIECFQRVYVELLLAHTKGNRSRAAKIAGIERSHFNKLANRLTGKSPQRTPRGSSSGEL